MIISSFSFSWGLLTAIETELKDFWALAYLVKRDGERKDSDEAHRECHKQTKVAIIIFSPRGKLYEFASFSMQETIERYRRHTKDTQTTNKSIEQNMQHLKHEAAAMMKKIEHLEVSKRRLLGEGLGTCSLEELQQIEEQLERSVSSIRARKAQVFKEQIELLKEKEKVLAAENARLCEKCGIQPQQGSNEQREILPYEESSPSSDVETELFIGPPEGRTKRSRLQT
ncbi:hypothetical protein CMV_008965 [Castanea mollissima]|uniref:K-box domain-containing protein n=1 Tax=Castanea mollissima TaxID=60419 RepID=A0A8J4VRC8_9ROSI|nr:hypothetical protein CMV_008965 [Castanea mollissima]